MSEFIMEQSHDPVGAWEENARNAQTMMEFLFGLSRQNHGFSVEGRLHILEEMKEYLAAISDRALRSLYIKQIAESLQIDERAVLEKVRDKVQTDSARRAGRQKHNADEHNVKGLRSDPREEQILSMMICHPDMIQMVEDSKVLDSFYSERLKKLARIIMEGRMDQQENLHDLLSRVEEPQDQELIAALAMKGNWDEVQNIQSAGKALIHRIIRVRQKNDNPLVSKIISAQKNGQEDVLDLLRQKQQEIEHLHHN